MDSQNQRQHQNQRPFTTARQSRNQKETSTTEARRHGEIQKQESTVKVKTSTRRTRRNFGGRGEPKTTKQNSSRHGTNLIVSSTEDTESTERSKTTTQQRAEALVRRIGETCDELERLAEENPELVRRVTRGAEEHKDAYLRLKARLQVADAAPRCRWVRQDGTSCGSPQMKKHIYCFAHRQMMEARALALSLPAPEDANAIQIGIMRIQKALIEGTISTKSAGLLLYSMQLALQNVGQVTFGQAKTVELVTETVSEQEAFRQNQTPTTETRRHGEEKSQNQTFETRRNGGSGGEEGLPWTDADERGFENGRQEIEFRLPLEMYRMDTREGREAYEEELRRRTRTSSDHGVGTAPNMAASERAEACANLG
jgi:hypothetical protein